MKFLLDQDVYNSTAYFLGSLRHDVLTVAEAGLSRMSDSDLLTTARGQGRILVTRDRDFGGLVFVQHHEGGVIYLRIAPSTQIAVHKEFARALEEHSESDLMEAFVVIEPGRHRFRKLTKR